MHCVNEVILSILMYFCIFDVSTATEACRLTSITSAMLCSAYDQSHVHFYLNRHFRFLCMENLE